MENRFGVKDFFLFAFLAALIVLVMLGIVQVDRQWQVIQTIKDQNDQHTRDLIDIRKMLANGGSIVQSATASTTVPAPGVDPFKPLKDAEAMNGFSRGDWLVDNFPAKVKALTPFIGADVYAAEVQGKVQEALLYRDVDTLDFVPLLARGWDISPDGLSVTFHLRPNVTFSDGEPFTADDVVFTFDWIQNKAVNAPRERSGLDKLVSVTKTDDLTVVFKFSEYYFRSLETVGGQGILAKHFYSKYTPEQFNQSTGLLIGTGPYRLDDPANWKPTGDAIILSRNDRYWGESPTFDRLLFKQVEEETAEQTMFSNGEIDIFAATAEQFVKLKQDPKFLAKGDPWEYVSLMGGYSYVGWNEKRDKPTRFADKKMRQAMTMLIDREGIARDVYLGYATVASGPFGATSKQSDPNVKPWAYDPEKAKVLLAELGYKPGSDGVIVGSDGQPFRFKLTYPNKSAVQDRVTLFMKDCFARAGVVMDRDPVEWPLLQKKLEERDFDAIMLAWSGSVDDDPYQMFDSSQMNDQGDNRISYSSPELDKALAAARTCVDPDKRTELWHQVHRILANDCPYTFMLNRKVTAFYSKRLANIRLTKMGTNRNMLDFNPIPWFVPKGKQVYTK